MDSNWFKEMFIDDVKAILPKGYGGGSSSTMAVHKTIDLSNYNATTDGESYAPLSELFGMVIVDGGLYCALADNQLFVNCDGPESLRLTVNIAGILTMEFNNVTRSYINGNLTSICCRGIIINELIQTELFIIFVHIDGQYQCMVVSDPNMGISETSTPAQS